MSIYFYTCLKLRQCITFPYLAIFPPKFLLRTALEPKGWQSIWHKDYFELKRAEKKLICPRAGHKSVGVPPSPLPRKDKSQSLKELPSWLSG